MPSLCGLKLGLQCCCGKGGGGASSGEHCSSVSLFPFAQCQRDQITQFYNLLFILFFSCVSIFFKGLSTSRNFLMGLYVQRIGNWGNVR